MFENVAEQWKQVLYLIRAGKGQNELVENHCGKKDLEDMGANLPSLLEMEVEDDMKKFAELVDVDLYSDDENDMVLDEELDSDDEDGDRDE